jgi:alkylation response protein AidB-like acyl-CoA dehydrogenase
MRVLQSKENDDFRAEVRAWLHAHVPRQRRPRDGWALREYDTAWQRRQFEGGWAGISWPKAYGGRGLSLLQELIWHEEYSRAGAPPSASMFVALSNAGPTLIVRGSEAQKAEYLPQILKGEKVWCQGFSEPGAGSDLGALKTRGEIDGDSLVVNGTKIWTSYGPVADLQVLLIRTDPAATKFRGMSLVVCDMKSPGIEVRPIKAMSGLTHFCQIFYDNVRVPLTNVVGQLHDGWSVAMTTVSMERGASTVAQQVELARTVERLVDIAKATPGYDGRPAIKDEATCAMLADLRTDVAAMRAMTAMSISRGLRATVPGPEGNLVALLFGEFIRRAHEAALHLMGPLGIERETPFGEWPIEFLESFKWAIGGGSTEIRRNAIGERLLGLPRSKS